MLFEAIRQHLTVSCCVPWSLHRQSAAPSMKVSDGPCSVFHLQISEQKQKKRLLSFTAAAYHHLSAIKIQRAYRIHLVLKLAQKQISSVLIIQVSLIQDKWVCVTVAFLSIKL